MRKYLLATLALLFVMAIVLTAPYRAESAKPSDVIIVNDPSDPVPIRDVDNPAHQPVQASRAAPSGTITGADNFVLFTVPEGKRLVVEHFSSEVGIASTASVNRYSLGIAPDPDVPGNVTFAHFIPPSYHSPCSICGSGNELVVASQPIRMYVNSGKALVVNITFSGAVGDSAFGFFAISGYLVNAQ